MPRRRKTIPFRRDLSFCKGCCRCEPSACAPDPAGCVYHGKRATYCPDTDGPRTHEAPFPDALSFDRVFSHLLED